MGIAFVGVFILLAEPTATARPLHLAVIVMAVVTWGLGSTIVKMIGPLNIFALNACMALFASVQLLLVSMLLETGQLTALQAASMAAWAGLLHMVLMAPVIGHGLWYYLIGKYDVTKVVLFTLLVPVASVLAGVFMMGEVLTFKQVAGGLVTLIGVTIIQLRWQHPLKPTIFPVEPTA